MERCHTGSDYSPYYRFQAAGSILAVPAFLAGCYSVVREGLFAAELRNPVEAVDRHFQLFDFLVSADLGCNKLHLVDHLHDLVLAAR